MNIGEEIVSAYLEYIKNCEFIQKNLYTDVQGEIDVVGINIDKKELFVCEVAIHLITGIQYVKNRQPNNVNKFIEKFSKNIEYTNQYFPDYCKHFMLWTPIVKNQNKKAKHNQLEDLRQVKNKINEKYNIKIELIINEEFLLRLNELRDFAKEYKKDSKSPVVRYLQIEEHLKKHVEKLHYVSN